MFVECSCVVYVFFFEPFPHHTLALGYMHVMDMNDAPWAEH